MRGRSAITRGRSGGRSSRTRCAPPPLRKVFRAWSTSAGTSDGSGETERVPVSMRPASSRSPIRPRMWSACWSMMRKNCTISAGSRPGEAPSTVAAEPLIEVSGARSSWLTMPRNSARSRSSSWSGAMSCMVTTSDSTAPSTERIGVALTRAVALLPPGTESTTSSARTVPKLAERRRQPGLGERDFASVGAPHDQRVLELLHRGARHAQALHDPPRLAIERHRTAGAEIDDDHADRRGLDQRLQVRARPPLVAVCAGVDDGRRRLRCEQQQDLLVLVRELPAILPSRRGRSRRRARPGGVSACPGRSPAAPGPWRSRASARSRPDSGAGSDPEARPGGRRDPARRAPIPLSAGDRRR